MLGIHTNLIQLLDSEPEKAHINAVPVLQNDTEPKQVRIEGETSSDHYVGTDSKTLFTFRPQRIQLGKEHEFFEDGDVHRHMYLQDLVTSEAEEAQPVKVSEFRCHISGCSELFNSLQAYEHHYSALHRHVCSTCRRCLPSSRLLDIHILEWHDSLFQIMAQKQSMYQCLVEGCELKFDSSAQRKSHLIKTHSYPADFRFDKTKKHKRPKEKEAATGSAQQRDTDMEVCEEGGDGSAPMDYGQNPVFGSEEGRTGSAAEPPQMSSQKPRYTYRVPPSICFGQGSIRGFRGGRRKK